MIDGVIDYFKLIDSMIFTNGYKPIFDEEGKIIQSKIQASQYKKRLKEQVKDGKILRFFMHNQISTPDCYKGFDNYINEIRKIEVDRLNEKYYGKEKYIKIKQCM